MGGESSTHERDEKYTQNFHWKNYRQKTTRYCMEVSGQLHISAALSMEEEPPGGLLMGGRTSLDMANKISATVKNLTSSSHFTD
jgi:hypothetical protein